MTQQKGLILPLDLIESLSEKILKEFPDGAIVGLSGELGSGKTTLVRSVIKTIAKRQGLKIDRVVSPSFVLHQSYEMLKPMVHHFDLYRLNKVDEAMLIELEYFDIIAKAEEAKGFVFVEWPELCVDKRVLRLRLQISIQIEENSRQYLFQTIK
ncbi:MAG: tRNA (adenosine(37)-N6)-threonylcarbamoyltransferase complex ATPase subunit type 1 TsaE [Deltaproteobacteria bacterium]|nr:tRNA (adenosine(37)-N6)-threonylcarbamoyltransferase complex ATPase subunit type 1 TsaE [Deltaproteobacteria bacterium]